MAFDWYLNDTPHVHTDGTVVRTNEYAQEAEAEVCRAIERVTGATVHHFGALAPIDAYASRDGRVVAWLEIKVRSHASTKWKHVFLSVRKWWYLMTAELFQEVPAFFVVRFTDGIRYIRVTDIDPRNMRVVKANRAYQSRNDREVVILVPVEKMRRLGK